MSELLKMKKEKYGFVYIWRDKKHNRLKIKDQQAPFGAFLLSGLSSTIL